MRLTAARTWVLLVAFLPLASALGADARRRRVAVKVVELAGGRAYLEPGEAAGVRRGQDVKIGGATYRVVETTAQHAVVDIGKGRLRDGDTGEVSVAVAEEATTRAAPSPLTRFAGQWKDPVRPATVQTPKPVPLGPGRRAGPVSLTVVEHGQIILPDGGGAVVAGELGVRLSVEPWQDPRVGLDADASALLWAGSGLAGDSASRPALRVRELRLRWGEAGDPWVSLGRLRWAAATVGALDGARLAAPVARGLTVAGFGGVLPDPIDGKPGTTAARFGAEAVFDRPDLDLSPRASLTAVGSTFDGELDERRLVATLELSPRPFSLSAFAEASMFSADNPWGASRVALTAAGVDVTVREGPWHGGARFDLVTPERSLYLASVLPRSWLCLARPLAPGMTEPCAGDTEARLAGTATAGVAAGDLALDAGASVLHGVGGFEADTFAAFVAGRAYRLLGRGRIELELDGVRAPFLDTAGARIAAGASLPGDVVDVTLHYRAAVLSYVAAVDNLLEHRIGADLALLPGTSLDILVGAEYTTSPEYRAFTLLTTVVWRSHP